MKCSAVVLILSLVLLTGCDPKIRAQASIAPRVLASYEAAQLAHIAETGILGELEDLIFMSDESDMWDYSEQSVGVYRATIKRTARIFEAGDYIETHISENGLISRTNNNPEAVQRYLPNWMLY
ncbi:hypothetical protein CHISP_1020 [Chitinispirillum alkaliphilum]|nr:hypothetical protein CHISP_1020 [Chitinispirillum alkaliphilum]